MVELSPEQHSSTAYVAKLAGGTGKSMTTRRLCSGRMRKWARLWRSHPLQVIIIVIVLHGSRRGDLLNVCIPGSDLAHQNPVHCH